MERRSDLPKVTLLMGFMSLSHCRAGVLSHLLQTQGRAGYAGDGGPTHGEMRHPATQALTAFLQGPCSPKYGQAQEEAGGAGRASWRKGHPTRKRRVWYRWT